MKFSIKDFFSKWDQILSFLRIWSILLNKSLMEYFIYHKYYILHFFEVLLTHYRPSTLHEKCPKKEFFLVHILFEYRKIRTRKNSVFGHFSRSDSLNTTCKYWESITVNFICHLTRNCTFLTTLSIAFWGNNVKLRKWWSFQCCFSCSYFSCIISKAFGI